MGKIDLSEDDQRQLLEVLERYYPELREELANTDDKDFRKFLKHREAFVHGLMDRLQGAVRT